MAKRKIRTPETQQKTVLFGAGPALVIAEELHKHEPLWASARRAARMVVASVALIRASLCFDQHALWAVVVAHCAGVERGEAEVSLDAAKAANESVPTLCDRAKCECRDTIGCCQGAWHLSLIHISEPTRPY